MSTSLLPPPLRTDADGRTIASFPTTTAASLAVERLRHAGFPVDLISVRPRGLAASSPALRPAPTAARPVVGAIAACVAGVCTVVAAGAGVVGVLAGAASALIAGCAAYAVDGLIVRRARSAATHEGHVVLVDRFDIVCKQRSAEAEHLLAAWWDPAAPRVVACVEGREATSAAPRTMEQRPSA